MAANVNVEELIPLIQAGVSTAGQIASAAVAAKQAKKKKEKASKDKTPVSASPSLPAPAPAPSGQSPWFWPLAIGTLAVMGLTVAFMVFRRPDPPRALTGTINGDAYGTAFRR